MKTQKLILRLFIIGALFSLLPVTTVASGGGANQGITFAETSKSLYDKGVKADKAGDEKSALQYFQKALELDKNNPEILNMLAHSQRKLGLIDEALENYWKALKIKPDFPEAREYLGEAYIQAALKEIEILKGYGKSGDEQRDDLIKALQDAAANVK